MCRGECSLRDYYQSIPFVARQIRDLKVKCPNHQITKEKSEYLQNQNEGQKEGEGETDQNEIQNPKIDDNTNSNNPSNTNSNRNTHKIPSNMNTKQILTINPLRIKRRNRWFRNKNKIRKRKLMEISGENSMDSKSRTKRRKLEDKNENKSYNEELCGWIGAYSELEGHIKQCPLHLVQCEYCNQDLLQKEMDLHSKICQLWEIECPQCITKCIPRYMLKKHIADECRLTKIRCIDCNELAARALIEAGTHSKYLCKEAEIDCSFAKFGCEWRAKRKYLKTHEQEFVLQHLDFVKQDNDRIRDRCDSMERRVKILERQIERLLPSPLPSDLENDNVVVLTDIDQSTEEDIDLFESE